MRSQMKSNISSNPKRWHVSRSGDWSPLLFTGIIVVGLAVPVGCTRSLYVGSSTTSDLDPLLPDSGSTGGRTGTGGTAVCADGAASPGTGGAPVIVAGCPTISTTPGQLNACGRTTGIAYSPDGQLVATATQTGSPNIHIWRLSDGALVRELEGHGRNGSYSVAFSPDGTTLATAGNAPVVENCGVTAGVALTDNAPSVVKLWDVATGNLLREIPAACGSYADAAQFSHDGKRLVTGGAANSVQVWNVADGALLATIPTGYTTYAARFSPDDTRIVNVGYVNGGVWRSTDGSLLFPITGLEDEMNDAAYSPDGSR